MCAVDRRLLRRPEAAADHNLRAALKRHARSIDRRLVWRLFTDALKRSERRRALRIVTAKPGNVVLVAAELGHVLRRRMRGFRRAVRSPISALG